MSERVCAVIVTYNRKDLLRECLNAVLGQTRPPDHVLVVDNASTDGTSEMLKEEFPQVEVLRLPENLGSAGGFHEGMKRAYEIGFDWSWLLDDDTLPEPFTLSLLVEGARRYDLAVVGPLPVSYDDPEKLAFPLLCRGITLQRLHLVDKGRPCFGTALFFLGVLLNRRVVTQVGLPDPRLFIRGEEVEYHRRVLRSGFRIAVLPWAIVKHPDLSKELFFLLGNRFAVVFSGNSVKDFYNFRNRMYIFRKHNRLWPFWVILESVRYVLFFLLVRKLDWVGLAFWARAAYLGLRGDLVSYDEFIKRGER